MSNPIKQFTIFDFRFNDEQLEEDFQKFFAVNKLNPLFNNEHKKTTHIKVSHADARAVVNEEGAHRETFKKFADYLAVANDNKSYEEAVFKIILESNSVRGMKNKIKRYMNYIDTFEPRHEFNTWNIVWYSKKLK